MNRFMRSIFCAIALWAGVPASGAAQDQRFDVNVEPHTNLVCTRCGRIEDFVACEDLIWAIRSRVADSAGFQPQGQRVDLYGLCSRCVAA